MRNGRAERIGAALLLAFAAQPGAAQDAAESEYEELTGAPKPVPVIPRPLAGIVRAVSSNALQVTALGGTPIAVDIEWYEPQEFELFADERYLGFSYTGYEAYGYVLVDRAMDGPEAVIDTGQQPVFSPDGRYFAAAEASEAGYGNLNGVALWEVLPRGTVRRFFTDALPWGWDWRIEGWNGSECVAVSAIVEDWLPQSEEEYRAGRATAPRLHYSLLVETFAVTLLNGFDQPGCTDLGAAP